MKQLPGGEDTALRPKTLWVLVLPAWRSSLETLQPVIYSDSSGIYSFQSKPIMMEAVPEGTSEHTNACGRHTLPRKCQLQVFQKNGLFGSWACLDEANQAVFVSGLAGDLLDWRGGQGLAGDAGSTQTETLGHTWKLMWRWSFITDKDDTQMANSSSFRNMFAFPLWLDSAHGWPAVLEEV